MIQYHREYLGEKTPTQYSPPTATVRVLRLLRRPYSVNIGTNVTIRAENTMFLNCPVAQNRKLKYFWMKGEKPFYRSNEDVNRKLVLRGIKNTDSGQYICVSNDPARVKFGTVSIDVIGKMKSSFFKSEFEYCIWAGEIGFRHLLLFSRESELNLT